MPHTNGTVRVRGWPDIFQASRKSLLFEMILEKNEQFWSISLKIWWIFYEKMVIFKRF